MKWLGNFEFLSRGKILQYALNESRFSPSIYKCRDGMNFYSYIGHLFYVNLCYLLSKKKSLNPLKQ
jgi:hypothetical protein